MSSSHIASPDLPEYMTWEELERLPEEIAGQIELWEGRVVWVRRGPAEHQDCTVEFRNALRRCAREDMSGGGENCWRVTIETNVFFGATGKSDFVTPDFLVYRCLENEYQDIRATDVYLAGEVRSPSNTERDIEAKKARYAGAGIPWYWEVLLGRAPRRITIVRAYALETGPGRLPTGVAPLRPTNYVVAGEWASATTDGIDFNFPFPIRIPWSELEF
ncbi:Uma2 family endonuclease [Nocardia terpenica]|uniref:Uma2 family endonuclease n=1 Tax=Nocardia terpenica TaxID=455432 RepID=UPI001E3128C4|nr:Uma2 family endonuclease [Nocardia terpenica]